MNQRLQPLVGALDSGNELQNPLVDSQRTSKEASGTGFNQPPIPQGAVAIDRAPVRVRQRRERKAEGRRPEPRIILGYRTRRGEPALQFDSGTEQQHVPLKRRETEDPSDVIE